MQYTTSILWKPKYRHKIKEGIGLMAAHQITQVVFISANWNTWSMLYIMNINEHCAMLYAVIDLRTTKIDYTYQVAFFGNIASDL